MPQQKSHNKWLEHVRYRSLGRSVMQLRLPLAKLLDVYRMKWMLR